MNIKQAKEQIKNAMTAYFSKDELGRYIIPIEKQRPVFLIGPPGIGKTAVMEQIAQEIGVGLVSYSMTHHTRQSAIGLPFIVKKNYGGVEYEVSEYTMSEIIASVYDMIEETGKKEGILFLDEVNCVSETLAPAMLQFLQYKIFGKHRIPDGWIVVTAGNPPEYNNSVREFDIVTLDRLKRIDVTADYFVWKEYAYHSSVHPSIITYLDIKKDDFYMVESTVDGKSFVTARGWSDLSDMIVLYEKNNIMVDELLISQYIQNKRISKDFSIYYTLFNKYKSDYQIDEILRGKNIEPIISKARNAKFDERLALVGLIMDAVSNEVKPINIYEKVINAYIDSFKNIKLELTKSANDAKTVIRDEIKNIEKSILSEKKASALSKENETVKRQLIDVLYKQIRNLGEKEIKTDTEVLKLLKVEFDEMLKDLKIRSNSVKKKISNSFDFLEKTFVNGQEILIYVTNITSNYNTVKFISKYGCDEYFKYNKELLFYERHIDIENRIKELEK